jgi:hypothetical protein
MMLLNGKLINYARVWFQSHITCQGTIQDNVALAFQLIVRACNRYGGTRWRSYLRHCATNQKVAGSIPDDVIGIFH